MNSRFPMAMAAGGILAGTAAAVAVGARRWRASTARAVAQLRAHRARSPAGVFTPEQLKGLPAPVIRYLEFALVAGQPLVARARVEQTGEFRIGGRDACWRPLTAVQHYSASPPGFVWDACIRMAPLIHVRVRDCYLDGCGAMQAQAASLVPLVNAPSQPELDRGALHRYLAEAVWFPTVFLPGQGVEWSPMDSTSALATLTDGRNSVALEFRFGPEGEIVGAYAPARARAVRGGYAPTPWVCSYRGYARVGGMNIPREAEVAWLPPEGRLPYFRGVIPTVEYEFAESHSRRRRDALGANPTLLHRLPG